MICLLLENTLNVLLTLEWRYESVAALYLQSINLCCTLTEALLDSIISIINHKGFLAI